MSAAAAAAAAVTAVMDSSSPVSLSAASLGSAPACIVFFGGGEGLSRARQFARCFLHCFIRALDICCITAVSVVVNAGEEAAEESEGGGWGSHCRMFINLTQVVFLLEISSVSVILAVAVRFC